jgi:hypothetical protein
MIMALGRPDIGVLVVISASMQVVTSSMKLRIDLTNLTVITYWSVTAQLIDAYIFILSADNLSSL